MSRWYGRGSVTPLRRRRGTPARTCGRIPKTARAKRSIQCCLELCGLCMDRSACRNRSPVRCERANGPACTPGSVPGPKPLGRSSLSATRCRAAPAAYPGTRRAASSSPVWPCSGRGLPCGRCHQRPGGLLHHPFTLTGTGVPAVCSLWHCLADRSGWVLPTALPCGARTFLGAGDPATRPSSRPIRGLDSIVRAVGTRGCRTSLPQIPGPVRYTSSNGTPWGADRFSLWGGDS